MPSTKCSPLSALSVVSSIHASSLPLLPPPPPPPPPPPRAPLPPPSPLAFPPLGRGSSFSTLCEMSSIRVHTSRRHVQWKRREEELTMLFYHHGNKYAEGLSKHFSASLCSNSATRVVLALLTSTAHCKVIT